MLKAQEIMGISPIIPVVSIHDASKAVETALALQEGGINIIEITLRSADAIKAIEAVAKAVPSMCVGAGTVVNAEQFQMVQDAGANFVISPGMTENLLKHAQTSEVPFLPGVATASDIMLGMEYGLDAFKLFPANVVGGQGALKAYGGPFSQISFCPTGGVTLMNMNQFLSMKNVLCVGGTWICPSDLIDAGDFKGISTLCKEAMIAVNRDAHDL